MLQRNNSANVLYRHTVNNFLPAKEHPSWPVLKAHLGARARAQATQRLYITSISACLRTFDRDKIFYLLPPRSQLRRRSHSIFSRLENRYVPFAEVEEGGNRWQWTSERCNFEMSIPVTHVSSHSFLQSTFFLSLSVSIPPSQVLPSLTAFLGVCIALM